MWAAEFGGRGSQKRICILKAGRRERPKGHIYRRRTCLTTARCATSTGGDGVCTLRVSARISRNAQMVKKTKKNSLNVLTL